MVLESGVRPADNPFASHRIDGLEYRFRDIGWKDLIESLELQGGRGAIVGPHGSGKTTLLEQLSGRLGGKLLWIRLHADQIRSNETSLSRLPQIVDGRHTILIDGAEQLGFWTWWRIRRRIRDAGTIVISSHHPGRLPTIYQCTTDPGLLTELVAELVPNAVGTVDLDELYQRHGGNIRLCFRELYDVWAGRAKAGSD